MTTLYHYTAVGALPQIAKDRSLKPFEHNGDGNIARGSYVYCSDTDTNAAWSVDDDGGCPRSAQTVNEAVWDKRLVRFTVRVPEADVRAIDYDTTLIKNHKTGETLPLSSAFTPKVRALMLHERLLTRAIPEREWLSVEWRAHPKGRWHALKIPIPTIEDAAIRLSVAA